MGSALFLILAVNLVVIKKSIIFYFCTIPNVTFDEMIQRIRKCFTKSTQGLVQNMGLGSCMSNVYFSDHDLLMSST